jgi:hypothetical protein
MILNQTQDPLITVTNRPLSLIKALIRERDSKENKVDFLHSTSAYTLDLSTNLYKQIGIIEANNGYLFSRQR